MSSKRTQTNFIIDRVKQWLDQEKYKFVMVDENHISIELHHDMKVSIVGSALYDFDSVVIGSAVKFSQEDIKAFRRLLEDKKELFLLDLKHDLNLINVLYSLVPNEDELERVEVKRPLYYDALTKDKFFDYLLTVIRGVNSCTLNYRKHLQKRNSRGLLSLMF